MAKKKPLRFAALIRVSTEKQEQQGESLRIQQADIARAVATLGGKIVEHYGGQEHATPGWEHAELDRLLKDARKKRRPFDAVMVQHPDRWSRDNVSSSTGLDLLFASGVQFYILTDRHDLSDPEHRLRLGFHALIGEYVAKTQTKKSITAKIERARRLDAPTSGNLPYGRIWDAKAEEWRIDPEKQAVIVEIAKRYVAGESMAELASEFSFSHPGLHKILTTRCGTEWTQRFTSRQLQIDEEVVCRIPRLLPPRTIQAIKRRLEANRTYAHGHLKYKYLLSRMIFCGHCKSAMSGQMTNDIRYYRHYGKRKNCIGTQVRADALEDVVLRHLFEDFGNPAAVQKAIEEAIPDREKMAEYLQRKERLGSELAKIDAGRERILDLIEKDAITDEQAERRLKAMKQKEAKLLEDVAKLDETLDGTPTPAAIKDAADTVAAAFRAHTKARWRFYRKVKHINRCIEDMTWEEQRALVQAVFAGKTAEGDRMGVYVYAMPGEKRRWRYSICGLLDAEGYFPLSDSQKEAFFQFGAAQRQRELIGVSHSPSPPRR
ncbi:MAG: recombinase family protein [Planctomycetes bacterium]|nr:recombinase family protein [Planctomycetota bacterium]